MVFEYMEHGDLADLLRRNDPAIGSGPCKAVELKQVRTTIAFYLIYSLCDNLCSFAIKYTSKANGHICLLQSGEWYTADPSMQTVRMDFHNAILAVHVQEINFQETFHFKKIFQQNLCILFSNKYAQFWLNLNDFHAWYINWHSFLFSHNRFGGFKWCI